jgi:hypothetical protein
MKKLMAIISVALWAAACRPGGGTVERRMEAGVEVVLNRKDPFRSSRDGPFALEEVTRIDTEREARMPEILGFDVDSAGDIFVLGWYIGEGGFILKFDADGRFLKSFGRKGQGPGEFENPHHIAVGSNDRLLITDLARGLVSEFAKDGTYVGTQPLEKAVRIGAGPRDTWIAQSVDQKLEMDKIQMTWSARLLDSTLNEIKELDSLRVGMSGSDFRFPEPLLCWSASSDQAFVADEGHGYEIRVFRSDGTLQRLIRKESAPVRVSDEFKAKILKPLPEPMHKAAHFADFHTPYQSLVASDDGRLLVMTFEPGDRPGEFLFDVFDKDGAWIGRKSLNAHVWEGHLWIRIRGRRFYCLQEKPNGFKEIAVSRIRWK